MEGGDQGNSIGRSFFGSRVGQQSMTRYVESPVDCKLDPAFAVSPRYKVLLSSDERLTYRVSVEQIRLIRKA